VSVQLTFAVECAIDELGDLLGTDPFAIRRQNMVRPDDWIESVWTMRIPIWRRMTPGLTGQTQRVAAFQRTG
jgi:CO/xanthine dehydrogenase Mo-binding subunit